MFNMTLQELARSAGKEVVSIEIYQPYSMKHWIVGLNGNKDSYACLTSTRSGRPREFKTINAAVSALSRAGVTLPVSVRMTQGVAS